MEKHTQYTSLEWACRALKTENLALLSQLAKQMISIIDPDAVFNPETIRAVDPSKPEASLPITYGDLSRYLEAATGRYVPVLFETPQFTLESQYVRVNVEWFNRQTSRARESLGLIEAIQAPVANDAVSLVYRQNASASEPIDQPPPMANDGLQHLHSLLAFKNDQRKAQEAAGKEAIARREAEEGLAKFRTLYEAKEAEYDRLFSEFTATLSDLNKSNRDLQDALADNAAMTEELAFVGHVAALLDAQNPYSPPVLRELIDCWVELTQGGTCDPVSAKRKGIGRLAAEWLTKRHGEPPKQLTEKLFQNALTPSDRKRGGAVSSTPKLNG